MLESALVGSAAAAAPCFSKPGTATASLASRTLLPTMLLNGTVSYSRPLLAPSQVSFRIGLARTRMSTYPCDSMDFIMMDLERPDGKHRHADFCTGDLTGRLLEFLSCAEGVDGKNDAQLDALFERILKQQRPSGFIGRYAAAPQQMEPEDDPLRGGASAKIFFGLARYYELTGDRRALTAAEGLANLLWSVRGEWEKRLKPGKDNRDVGFWAIEPLARLYGITKDARWLKFCEMTTQYLASCENRICHSHGHLTTLRGLQVMALITGDLSWNKLAETDRQTIIEKKMEMPDGNIPERFPTSERNEGCSIADWMMLNLNHGLIYGDDAAYDRAERIFWNALAFNQLVTGGFGHRRISANGYGVDKIHEAWWCCTPDAGMAMADYARHAITFHRGTIRINFLIPGQYELPLPGNHWAYVKVASDYPAKADALVEVTNISDTMPIKIRIPACVRNANVEETRSAGKATLKFHGEMGHRIEPCHPGVMVTYGPLILIPAKGIETGVSALSDPGTQGIPIGYVPQSLPPGVPKIKLDAPADAEGFVHLPLCPPERPIPTWSYFDESPGSPTQVEGAAVEVVLTYPSGKIFPVRFTPMCYNTSQLSLFDTAMIFQGVE